jgi:hypothetical protein
VWVWSENGEFYLNSSHILFFQIKYHPVKKKFIVWAKIAVIDLVGIGYFDTLWDAQKYLIGDFGVKGVEEEQV